MTSLLQLKIDTSLKDAIKRRADQYGVSISAIVKIALVEAFAAEDFVRGNIFNANRDNNGEGIALDTLIDQL
ncbi:hypothetical protein COV81_04035 [Candidatus Peregrinibacteria bacterium CG11_big_fil_rev_8_21_14_0_20_41_10]|nr:MAG: hypothetical protein COV81_04035 [Candidatus Peregrinibacteria bacterium CG11_big_fil_rev_8_21_14_0_20_41_10]PIZ75386.1 MAG: hypothetical protein COY06_03030 [Candidatus Peregrinibacteria bacterium CG_4_10_14_0_2_um_filter_41_8]PJC38284.1 MAG: hypothetical protein CO045_01130 [Candidatus Peregrinibacteria bacterium CG_4_9_14_0_2_um_filter_41_14]